MKFENKYLIFFILIFCISSLNAESQENHLLYLQIDSSLNNKFNQKNNLDTLSPFVGHTIFYKRILGIKICNGKGETYEQYIYLDKDFICYKRTDIKNKRSSNEYSVTTYYFLNDKLAKFREEIFIIYKKEDRRENMHRLIFYFDNIQVIHQELNINDNADESKYKAGQIVSTAEGIYTSAKNEKQNIY